ncbi:MAG TPA: crossover junction endodeoxyribonuclease RuvC [Chitinophagaceae bacterium]|nr:crossover junction endodeoxyribonuclease RuvC [Chitinophagaceae bacterium]
MKHKSEIILGIDPGTQLMGYGIIHIENNKASLIEMGVLKLAKYHDTNQRLRIIYNKVSELHRVFHPTQFAIEAPFFGKNVQSMLKLGRAQGVAIASAMQHGLSAYEYSPKKVKQSITGNGNASKEQVLKMLQEILKIDERPEYLDATDAVAVALCHHYQNSKIGTSDTSKTWEAFLKNNAHRIKK